MGVKRRRQSVLLSNYPVEPSWVASIRMALAGLLLTFMVIPKKSHLIRQMLHDPISLRHLIIFAIFGLTLSQFSYLSAIKNSNAGTATVLQTLCVVFMSFYLAVRSISGRRRGNHLRFPGLWRRILVSNPGQPVNDGPLAPWPYLGPHGRRRRCRLSRFISRPGRPLGGLITNGLGMITGVSS
mgnify:CR=1 FL=1